MEKLAIVNIGGTFGSPFSVNGGKTIGDLLGVILNVSFVLAGIAILFLLIFAGLSIIIGAGSNNPENTEKGKKAATAAVVGLVIIFSAYWIIRIIELITGNSFITQPNF